MVGEYSEVLAFEIEMVGLRLLELSEDELLRQLADYQREQERTRGYTMRARATAAGVFEYWRRHRGRQSPNGPVWIYDRGGRR
jgi:hypothetical protein